MAKNNKSGGESVDKNSSLSAAKKAKNDEFYTQWADIEREINAYLEYDPDVFRDKVVLLPCDDPEWSNFTKFFALHFTDFGLKKLISTSYAPESNAKGIFYSPTLFEMDHPDYDEDKSREKGRSFTLTREDISGDGQVNIDDLRWEYLDDDGDFRHASVTKLRDEADFVITNPPFSLFKEFVEWIISGGKKFSIVGTKNATTYKEIFPLIKGNQMWLGRGFNRGDAYFRVPEAARTSYASGVFDPETQLVHFRNVSWFTNIEHGLRHEPLELMTMDDNIKFSKHKKVREEGYPRYDNFDAIEVPFVDAIPSDYEGIMGVPITFLDKYNPDQFEIVGSSEGDYPATKKYREKVRVVNGVRMKSNTGTLSGAIRVDSFGSGTYFDVGYPVKGVFKRIFIRHRKPSSSGSKK